jgi:hypothetical protein
MNKKIRGRTLILLSQKTVIGLGLLLSGSPQGSGVYSQIPHPTPKKIAMSI